MPLLVDGDGGSSSVHIRRRTPCELARASPVPDAHPGARSPLFDGEQIELDSCVGAFRFRVGAQSGLVIPAHQGTEVLSSSVTEYKP